MGNSNLSGGAARGIAAYRKTLVQSDVAAEFPAEIPPEPSAEIPAGNSAESAEQDGFKPGLPELMVFPELAVSLPPRFPDTRNAEEAQPSLPAEIPPNASPKPPKSLPKVSPKVSPKPSQTAGLDPRIKPAPWLTAAPLAKIALTGAAPASRVEPVKAAPAPSGFIKTTPAKRSADSEAQKDSKYRRVAKFLILVGGEEAAKILSSLDIAQVEAISQEIATIKGITSEEAAAIFDEFRSLLGSSGASGGGFSGGVDAARRLLYAAFGPEKGERFLARAVPRRKDNPFDFLAELSGEQIALLLREESPAAAALVLSRLAPNQSAAALAKLPAERKLEVVKRIAGLRQTDTETLERVAEALREKARKISDSGGGDTVSLDGRNALAAILKHTDLDVGGRLLEELENEDPGLSRDLKERIHTLEDVIKAEDKPIQEKLRSMSDRDIALLLKGRAGELSEKIFANVSAGRRQRIREEGEIIGLVPKREADQAVRDFLAWFRQKREEGHILLIDDKDVVV
ncbi:MAG: flagellar motor switch protein FliG [Treponema sp.]|jgi:flagellar motor switch protein FliG|nr:flagellar motor switch protein FliG [Treponema sp.]